MKSYNNDPDFDLITGLVMAAFGVMAVIFFIWLACHYENLHQREYPADSRSAKWAEYNRLKYSL